MIFNQQVKSYLKGDSFSSTFIINIDKTRYSPKRREILICDMVAGKRVVHVGCADHVELIERKRKQGIWLHELLVGSASKCVGIDINCEGIEYMKKTLAIPDVYCADIIKDKIQPLKEEKWDYIILGEIVEHLDNPVAFLKFIHENYHQNIDRFIVTVPSIFTIKRWKDVLKYREVINTDHRFWFTPYTISKVLVSSGFEPDEINYSNLCKLTFPQRVLRKIKRIAGMEIKFPFYYFNNLVITGRL
jgi:hypothetical protein